MPLPTTDLAANQQEGAPEPAPASERRSFWRTSFLVITSAAFGGIAVAIWNRRTLALMRQPSETQND